MKTTSALSKNKKTLVSKIGFNELDTLVIFGEAFTGGYVSGLVEAAGALGMRVIYSTVGRRDVGGNLRKLNPEELGGRRGLINIPLEAGFDMEFSDLGVRPIDLCKGMKLKGWEECFLDPVVLESCRKNAQDSFRERVKKWSMELEKQLPSKGNVLFVHTMAGGVPRSKILYPILNRILKGFGKRFFSSETFWNTDLGQLCENNFKEVTAQTYRHLLEITSVLRGKLESQNRKVLYTAYSYHGTEVLVGTNYHWQSYAPYLQGFAKLELEKISEEFALEGVDTCVFNVPEILTKSSAIFPGVEIPLYTILGALKKEGGGEAILDRCYKKMKNNALQTIMDTTEKYFTAKEIKKQNIFEKWPQHNSPAHMEKMLFTSKILEDLHIDSRESITSFLSEVLFKNCGSLILQEMSQPKPLAVCWLGHDVIAANIRANA